MVGRGDEDRNQIVNKLENIELGKILIRMSGVEDSSNPTRFTDFRVDYFLCQLG